MKNPANNPKNSLKLPARLNIQVGVTQELLETFSSYVQDGPSVKNLELFAAALFHAALFDYHDARMEKGRKTRKKRK